MKSLSLLSTLALPLAAMLSPVEAFAQGPNTNNSPAQGMQAKNKNYYIQINNGNNMISQTVNLPSYQQQAGGLVSLFGSNKTNEGPCADCDNVKKTIKLSHASSGGGSYKKSFSMKKWSRTFSGKMHMKMKKTFVRKHKVRSSYSLCFNWN